LTENIRIKKEVTTVFRLTLNMHIWLTSLLFIVFETKQYYSCHNGRSVLSNCKLQTLQGNYYFSDISSTVELYNHIKSVHMMLKAKSIVL